MCLDHSPFNSSLFLVGYSSGRFSLFSTSRSTSICWWNLTDAQGGSIGAGVVKVKWSRQRPSVFYVVGTNGCFSIFDLSESNRRPVYSGRNFLTGSQIFTDMAVGGATKYASIAFAGESGNVEVLGLDSEYTLAGVDESEALNEYIR